MGTYNFEPNTSKSRQLINNKLFINLYVIQRDQIKY